MTISAKVIADSISPEGIRLTTMQLRRLITQEPGPDISETSLESLQTAFWWNMANAFCRSRDT